MRCTNTQALTKLRPIFKEPKSFTSEAMNQSISIYNGLRTRRIGIARPVVRWRTKSLFQRKPLKSRLHPRSFNRFVVFYYLVETLRVFRFHRVASIPFIIA